MHKVILRVVALALWTAMSGAMLDGKANAESQHNDDLKPIIEAYVRSSAADTGLSGHGTARVVEIETLGEKCIKAEKTYCTFAFKPKRSKTVSYELAQRGADQAEGPGAWKLTEALEPERMVRFNPIEVNIARPPRTDRGWGEDFSPEVFTKGLEGAKFVSLLNYVASLPPSSTKISRTKEGLVRLETNSLVDGVDTLGTFVMDPRAGMRIVECIIDDRLPSTLTRVKRWCATFVWEEHDGMWYPKQAELELEDLRKPEESPGSKTRESQLVQYKSKLSINVRTIDLISPVGDEEFELPALNIPQGKHVSDDILGMGYQYGTTADSQPLLR